MERTGLLQLLQLGIPQNAHVTKLHFEFEANYVAASESINLSAEYAGNIIPDAVVTAEFGAGRVSVKLDAPASVPVEPPQEFSRPAEDSSAAASDE